MSAVLRLRKPGLEEQIANGHLKGLENSSFSVRLSYWWGTATKVASNFTRAYCHLTKGFKA